MASTIYTLTTLSNTAAHWRFRENLYDETANRITLTGLTGETYYTGVTEPVLSSATPGTAFAVTKTDPRLAALSLSTGSFTVEAILSAPTSVEFEGQIASHLLTVGANKRGWQLSISLAGKMTLELNDGRPSNFTMTGTSDLRAANTKRYLAAVVDRSGANNVRFYINGIEDVHGPWSLTSNISGSLSVYPHQNFSVGTFSPMRFDELCITKRALTAAEILARSQGHGDPLVFSYSGSASVSSNTVETNLNTFDVKLKHVCDHLLSAGAYSLNSCPRCVGTGYYYDIRFDVSGRPALVTVEDKLSQALEKLVLTSSNTFHQDLTVDIKSRIGQLNQSNIKPLIQYDLQKALAFMQQNQREVTNLSSRARIAKIDSINVTDDRPTGLKYVVMITTLSGESLELAGTINVV